MHHTALQDTARDALHNKGSVAQKKGHSIVFTDSIWRTTQPKCSSTASYSRAHLHESLCVMTMSWMRLVFFLVVHFVTASFTAAVGLHDSTGCRRIAHSIQQCLNNTESKKVVVYRCHEEDDCGGWADRLAGIFGAAFLAMTMQRRFALDFPGLQDVFELRGPNWTYKTDRNTGYVLDALCKDDFRRRDSWRRYEQHDLIIFHGNRGANAEWYQHLAAKLDWGRVAGGWKEAYRCIFHGMFSLQPAFMESAMVLYNGTSIPYHVLLHRQSRPRTLTIGVHYRLADAKSPDWLASNLNMSFLLRRSWACAYNVARAMTNLGHSKFMGSRSPWSIVLRRLRNAAPRLLVHFIFVSSSHRANEWVRQVYNNSLLRSAELWSPRITGEIHINRKEFAQGLPNATLAQMHAFRHAIRDWWLLLNANVVISDWQSGFSGSAMLLARPGQQHLHYDRCRPEPLVQCYGRFC